MNGRLSQLASQLRRWLGLEQRTIETTPAPPAAPPFVAATLALELFTRLHRSGFNIGVPELLALHTAAAGGWGASPDALAATARLLWCNSRQEQAEFDLQWQAVAAALAEHRAPPPKSLVKEPAPGPERVAEPSWSPPAEGGRVNTERQLELAALPVRAPFMPAPVQSEDALQNYWPVSRRAMVYAWRYLRRPVADGPRDVLDVAATVARTARQGFYLAPVYQRRMRNHAHLLLLVDQGGSMTPCHRFTRNLVETAQLESGLEQVEVYYFQNAFSDTLFADPHRTEAVPLAEALAACTADTSVLVVSDAGAARGRRSRERVRLTALALAELKSRTALLAWLNPMPRPRWRDSSAQLIASLVPMYPMNADGVSNAIDQLRGQG